ncbi:MAG: nuclear transport factor 2 family protein [Verrucomicrobiae bacterium]|nr:nuclear transport factor 2 family protein [Verrucomicrobiae bacterium]
MKRIMLLSFAFAALATFSSFAAEDPVHNELRALRDKVLDGINKQDVDGVISCLSTNVVITWQNNDVCRGHAGVREHFERMGKNAFKGYKEPPAADELTILTGDNTGVVFGHSVGTYKLLGSEFEFKNRWTATLVKENGKWVLASYHVSLNALDNPILNAAKKGLYWAGGIGALIGIVVGALLSRMCCKSKSTAPVQ